LETKPSNFVYFSRLKEEVCFAILGIAPTLFSLLAINKNKAKASFGANFD
jgi:hypothetical protein